MDFYEQLILEIIKAIGAFSLGLISFKTFERFKNKKENNKLYISLIKIEKELLLNKDKIVQLINKNIAIEILLEQYYINGEFNEELYNLYKDISNLSFYKSIDEDRDENGEVIDVIESYDDKEYKTIDQIISYLSCCESYEVEDLEEKLKILEESNIYDEFKKIHSRIEKIIQYEFDMKEGIIFLKEKLEAYNKLSDIDKRKYLQKFCELILEEDNLFTKTLSSYKKINNEKVNLSRSKDIKLTFSLWNSISVDTLSIYDAEAYIQIEDIYEELNNIKINSNNMESLEKVNLQIEKLLNYIRRDKKKLKKILVKNNRYFKYV